MYRKRHESILRSFCSDGFKDFNSTTHPELTKLMPEVMTFFRLCMLMSYFPLENAQVLEHIH